VGNDKKVGVGSMTQARMFHTATLLPNGTVLLVGGYGASGDATATAEIYDATDPAADKFTAVANVPGKDAPAAHTATLITKSGKAMVLIAGGGSALSRLYDVTAKTWSSSGSMPVPRSAHTATLVGTKVFVAGGEDNSSNALQSTVFYDIAAGTFANGPTMLAARELHTATVIANGKVLLSGGTTRSGNNYSVALTPLAEIYDPGNAATPFAAASFASGTGRYGHGATALNAASGLPDGRVLITGGSVNYPCGVPLGTSELFASGTFATGVPLTSGRLGHTATLLKDGRVLVAGGLGGSTNNSCTPLSTVEIWTGSSP
jgi:hypothetical protein